MLMNVIDAHVGVTMPLLIPTCHTRITKVLCQSNNLYMLFLRQGGSTPVRTPKGTSHQRAYHCGRPFAVSLVSRLAAGSCGQWGSEADQISTFTILYIRLLKSTYFLVFNTLFQLMQKVYPKGGFHCIRCP